MIFQPGHYPTTQKPAPQTPVPPVPAADPAIRRSRGQASYHAGLSAEAQVARHYASRGAKIVAQRWRGRAGEVDLVADDGTQLIFIEVKRSRTFAQGIERVTPHQVARILQTAEEYADRHAQGSLTEMRCDVAVVTGSGSIRVVENAFL